MKTKKEFIKQVYFDCKNCIDTDDEIEVIGHDGEIAFKFYLDEGNETLKVYNIDSYKDIFKELDVETAFLYAKCICECYLGQTVCSLYDERSINFDKKVADWRQTMIDCENEIKEYFKNNDIGDVDIDLPHDMYRIEALDCSVRFLSVYVVDDTVKINVEIPIIYSGQVFEWHNTEIEFGDICQDDVMLSDFMYAFYEATFDIE